MLIGNILERKLVKIISSYFRRDLPSRLTKLCKGDKIYFKDTVLGTSISPREHSDSSTPDGSPSPRSSSTFWYMKTPLISLFQFGILEEQILKCIKIYQQFGLPFYFRDCTLGILLVKVFLKLLIFI